MSVGFSLDRRSGPRRRSLFRSRIRNAGRSDIDASRRTRLAGPDPEFAVLVSHPSFGPPHSEKLDLRSRTWRGSPPSDTVNGIVLSGPLGIAGRGGAGQPLQEPGPEVDRQQGERASQQGDHATRPHDGQMSQQLAYHGRPP